MSFSGKAKLQSSSSKQLKLKITGCAGLSLLNVNLGTPFSGGYDPTSLSAAVNVPQANFDDLKNLLAGGVSVSITLTVDANNHVTQFCYNDTTCLSASAGLTAGVAGAATVAAARVDTAIPNSGVKNKDGESTDDTSATGTE
jgi:hypothetical protein